VIGGMPLTENDRPIWINPALTLTFTGLNSVV
jgi:hypothetical protein